VMPDCIDGFELADRVRKHQPDLPILFMTGASLHEYSARDLPSWEHLLLRKPFTPDRLLNFVAEHLEAANQPT
jgi:CheY-like chemotaxis protein